MSLTGDVLGQIGAEVSLNGGVGGSIQFTGEGTDNYDELDNKPSINGVVLTGNKTTADLQIDTGGTDDYLDLNNKPKINSVTLRGDVSSASLQISYNDLTDRPVIPDITDLENRMDAVEGDIQSIETDIGDIGDRLIDIASDIATIQATDLVQNSDISSLKNRMNAAETSITNLGSRLTTAEGTISTHTTDISDLDNRLDTAEDNISDLQGDVTSLDTIVGDGQQTVGSDLTDAVTQLNSSLMKCQQVQFVLPQTKTINANSSGILLDHFDISTSTITDTIFTNKTLTQLFGGHTVLGVVGLWCSSGLIPLETIVWANTNELTIRFYNQASSSITVTSIRLLVFYI